MKGRLKKVLVMGLVVATCKSSMPSKVYAESDVNVPVVTEQTDDFSSYEEEEPYNEENSAESDVTDEAEQQ